MQITSGILLLAFFSQAYASPALFPRNDPESSTGSEVSQNATPTPIPTPSSSIGPSSSLSSSASESTPSSSSPRASMSASYFGSGPGASTSSVRFIFHHHRTSSSTLSSSSSWVSPSSIPVATPIIDDTASSDGSSLLVSPPSTPVATPIMDGTTSSAESSFLPSSYQSQDGTSTPVTSQPSVSSVVATATPKPSALHGNHMNHHDQAIEKELQSMERTREETIKFFEFIQTDAPTPSQCSRFCHNGHDWIHPQTRQLCSKHCR